MTTVLLIALIAFDLLLMAIVLYDRRTHHGGRLELIAELTEERRLLTELRQTVQEELETAQRRARETLEQANQLATEAEHEVKSSGSTIASEMQAVATEVTARFEEPVRELTRKQTAVENLLRRVDQEKATLTRLLARGEKICKFFDERVPYEEVLEEITDKKYADARALLARGQAPGTVARELGLSESEVRLIAGVAGA